MPVENAAFRVWFRFHLSQKVPGMEQSGCLQKDMVRLVLGSIRMPAMISILKLPSRIAIGTNLASSSVMGTVGVNGHLMNGNIDYVVLSAMGPPAMLGAFMGAKYTNRINESNLKFIIAMVLSLVAVTILWRVAELIILI